MNTIAENILLGYETENEIAKNILMHYGTKRHSGRYPWGSGDNPYQHELDFVERCRKLRATGMSEIDLAHEFGFETTSQLRSALTMANNDIAAYRINWAKALIKDGCSQTEAARRIGINESSLRALLDEQRQARVNQAEETANILRDIVKDKGPIDIGKNVNHELNISEGKLNQAVEILKKEGYEVRVGSMPQVTNEHGQRTTLKVLCPPGAPKNAAYIYDNISSIVNYTNEYTSHDNGKTVDKFHYPASMDSKRILIKYAEDGGSERDGLIEIRRDCPPDLSLGNSRYCQVRILVDGNKYVKGMACYSDRVPEGYDMIVNSHYSRESGKALKDIKKDDPNNPFGSLIKANGQSYYIDPKTGERKLSLINKRAEEGDWNSWSKSLPSQFLSKQNPKLIKNQLDLSIADKMDEYEEISSLTNPTVKRYFLEKFADDCDNTAVHLNAAALPRQRYQVIVPISSLKDNEIYAPNFKPGEKVALVRYPHGGIFEIPVLTVNNKNREGISLLTKNPTDAVGINAEVAKQLSGADFDGDTVMVIPISSKVNISHRKYLKELEGFDPHEAYPERPGMNYMKRTDREMGKITNLIMDMTLAGAPDSEVARAIKHSMVVIDAAKHKLDWQLSEKENGIQELRDKYQGRIDPETGEKIGGAATIVTLAKSPTRVTKRRGEFHIDPKTGKKTWNDAYDAHYIDKNGNEKTRTQESYKMLETDDPYSLVSKNQHQTELFYADYAAKLKALANRARKEYAYEVGNLEYSPSANKTYAMEVESLKDKLKQSKLNAPREREAQRRANVRMNEILTINPELKKDKKERGKRAQQELTKARYEVGAQRFQIEITPKEWEAIQAGAVHDSFLKEILNATDVDVIRSYATPKTSKSLSTAKVNRLLALERSGHTNQEIADALNVPVSTVLYYLKKEK